jgi:hypothetical protein
MTKETNVCNRWNYICRIIYLNDSLVNNLQVYSNGGQKCVFKGHVYSLKFKDII